MFLAYIVIVRTIELHALEGALGSLKARARRSEACRLLLGPVLVRRSLSVLSAVLLDPSVCVFKNVVF
jgi:hypothetical protein